MDAENFFPFLSKKRMKKENAAWIYNSSPEEELLVICHYSWVLVCGYQSFIPGLCISLFLSISQPIIITHFCPSGACVLSRPSDSRHPHGSPPWPMSPPSSHCTSYLHQVLSVSWPLLSGLIADLKCMQRITWAVSSDSPCCVIHYSHFNEILLGTQRLKSKEEASNGGFSGIKPD